MLFVWNTNVLKYFRAINRAIDFYKHFISIDHLSFIILYFLFWPQNIKEILVATWWLLLTSKNLMNLTNVDKFWILSNIRSKQKKWKSLRSMLMSLGFVLGSRKEEAEKDLVQWYSLRNSLWKWWRNWLNWG